MPRIYPNAPLEEVVFEIRYPAELSIESNRDLFYSRIRKDFPLIYVPKINESMAPALQPYSFKNNEDTKQIQFSITAMSFHIKQYEGFNKFKRESLKHIKEFTKLYGIDYLNRTGLRYVNRIPITRDNNLLVISKYLNFGYNLPASIPSDIEALETQLLTKLGKGKLRTAIKAYREESNPVVEYILLDFDYYYEGELTVSNITNYLDKSHTHIKKIFEDIVSENYKKYMSGDIKT